MSSESPYTVLNSSSTTPLLFICEHASNAIPDEYYNLGLSKETLKQHVAWDIGMREITTRLAKRFNAPAILANFSRLLIDPNRSEDQTGLIPEISDGILILGNKGINTQQIEKRLKEYYYPFHNKVAEVVSHLKRNQVTPLVCGMHSFTPVMDGYNRPWHAGLLWDKDPRLAQALVKKLRSKGLFVGDNEPYSGRELFHTMTEHGAKHGFPHATIEIRQDLVSDKYGVEKWVDYLYHDLNSLLEHSNLRQMKYYRDK